MRNKLLRWLLITGFAVAGVAGVAYLVRPKPLEVETGRVECGPMEVTISSEGRTRVRDRFVVSSPVEGNIGRLGVREGDAVKRGTILTWVTPAPLEIRSQREHQASLQTAESEKRVAEAQAARARQELEQAVRDRQRISSLVEHGIRPQQDLDMAQTAENSARQLVDAANFTVAAAASRIEEIRSTLFAGSAHAIPVRSPTEGVVLRITEPSERILPAGAPVVELGDPRRVELVFEILSTDAVRVRPGAKVVVQNWGGEETLAATVRLVEPGAFTKVSALGVEEQRVNVIADFAGAPAILGDGYRIEGEIVTWESADIVQVPVSALFRKGAEWQVFVVEGRRAFLRGIEIGHRNQKNAEVVKGLAEGEVVVLYPDDRLKHGQAVQTQQ